jgi:protein-disulfide isomerase
MIPLRRSAFAVGLFAVAGVLAAQFGPIPAVNAQDAGFSGDQKKAIEKIIKDYLVANPEVLQEAMSVYEAKMEKAQAEKAKVALSENAKEIYRRANAPVAGNADGDITVTEFFDYNCGYCKKSLPDITKLIGEDKKVRVVFKEFPILSKGSEEAAKVALAARIQGKYWEVHTALLEAKGQANEASAMKIAEKLGLDLVKLKADMEGAEVKAELASVKELAAKMGINGTPHFLVGDKSIAGAPQDLLPQLTGHIGDLRKTGCTFC